MLLAIAALLVQPSIVPQNSFSVNAGDESSETAIISLSINDLSGMALRQPEAPRLPAEPTSASSVMVAVIPVETSPAPEPAITLPKPLKPMTVSVDELAREGRRNERIWMGLGAAAHGAATFDAWTTRRAIRSGGQEVNPLLKPFASNASIYAAIQVAPAVVDYVGRKMMYSRHPWVRRMWWVPQTASFAGSLFCGSHNLGVHPQY